jgi:uncharacterized protein (DUF2062 family)
MKKMRNLSDRIIKILNSLYIKLFKINDTPQRIAIGFGLGVALGILPGTGPLAALFLALALRVNRASALIGSLLTNTWLSFATFSLAVVIGSAILKIRLVDAYQALNSILTKFSWQSLLKLPVLKIIAPLLVGYCVISLILGILSYLTTLVIIRKVKR